MINTTVIGYGYWGRNIARNVHSNSDMHLETIVEPNSGAHGDAACQYPMTRIYSDLGHVSPTVLRSSMVFICTPPQTHAKVLGQLKDLGVTNICISKPYCLNAKDAEEYKDIVKMVDYTFLFSNAIRELPKWIDKIGAIQHVSCVRANLGKVQECGVLHDLTVHDLSILKRIGFHLKSVPNRSTVGNLIADTFYAGARGIHSNISVIHIHGSWLSHLKRKVMIFTGSEGILVYDDNEPADKITIYEKFIENPTDTDLMQYKYGDTLIPYIPANNPLGDMVEEFRLACINDSTHRTVRLAIDIHKHLEKVAS